MTITLETLEEYENLKHLMMFRGSGPGMAEYCEQFYMKLVTHAGPEVGL
ncbi:hypothetical protein HQO42_14860 [Rhodococcus fascians]|nr:hypothetical protein [Rhodococcus fascians]MBY4237736.1 hypothetical protein [Rhodococcus fascians]MBY4253939.1 hypothetical protein [Rhodococcus fascians]MBY4269190.1 hypothetical protein [Rhodococcus fascians]